MKKAIRTWTDQVQVGIFENCNMVVKLFADKATARIPYVKWTGNSGNLDYRTVVLSADDEAKIRQLADNDYTSAIMRIAWEY